MNPEKPRPPGDADEEISALIEALVETDQRLEDLTAGKVDAVADRRGRTLLLRRAQDQLRHSEAAKQTAILNALPAHIALLDAQGRIISVNEAWRRFAGATAIQRPGYGIGINYIEICDGACGDDATEAHQAAAGIRSVLDGSATSFSMEYPCHSPAEQRWFLLTVTPLADDRLAGAIVMHLDITQRKRGEEALRESETRFRILTAMSSDFYWESDAEHRLTARDSANRKVSSVSVFQRGAQIGERRWEIPHLSPDEAGWQAHRAVLDAHLPFRDFELSRLGTDGAERHISISGDPVFDASGVFQGYRGVGTDVTERKQAAQQLRESERRFSDMLRNAELATVMLDREGRITYCNEYLLRLTGWRLEEVIGRNWVDVFTPPEIADARKDAFAAMLANLPDARHRENKILTRSGERRLIRWNNSLLRSGAGEVIGTASIGEDITERKRTEQALARLVAIIEATPDLVGMCDLKGDLLYLNRAGLRMLGLEPGLDLSTVRYLETLSDWAAKLVAETGIPHAIEHGTWSGETALLRPDGREIPISQVLIAHKGSDGSVEYLSTIARDITLQKEHERRITRLNRVYAMLSGINTLIVRTRDRQELFEEACRITVEQGEFRLAWIGLLDANGMDITPVARAGVDEGYLGNIQLTAREDAPDRCEVLARALREKTAVVCNDIDTDPQIARWREEALRRGYRSVVVFPLQFADKVLGVVALYASEKDFFDTEEMKVLTELARNISFAIDHIDKQARLDYLAYYDELTGLANRSLFLDRVAQYMRSAAGGGHELAVFLIDLERFKNINDSLGQPAGDALLRQVAEWLTRNAGDANLLARTGADHFALVLPQVRQAGDVTRLLEKTTAAFLDHPFRLNDAVFRISAKVGVAVFPDDGADAETLFRNAEAALKKAKASGARYLFYTQSMTASVAAKLTLENQLRQALDNEEFVLHYQPKVNLASGKLTGAEALIRWNDPRTGLVPPGRFIPILEETGMIYDVGRWALKKAIADYLRWCAAGLPAVRIAVNVSPLQLRNRGFIDEIRQAIGTDAQATAGLELEITESLIMEDVKHSIASLRAIRDLGVSIAIDDFGTGFSSLSYLAKLPVDTLKIDRSFVIEMTVAQEGLALVSTIISLAHSLKLKVVAEGVETEEQSRLLRLLACDEMQGFLFSKPVPSEIFEAKFLAPPATG